MKSFVVILREARGKRGAVSICKVAVAAEDWSEATSIALRLSLFSVDKTEIEYREIAPHGGLMITRG